MNIIEAIDLIEEKLFAQGKSKEYTTYDKLVDDAWDLIKAKVDYTDAEFNQVFNSGKFYDPEAEKILRQSDSTQDLPDSDVGC